MKKVILFIVSVLVLFNLCACGKQNVDNPPQEKNPLDNISDTSNESAGEIKNDRFNAVMEFDGDHYVLKILTYLTNEETHITYNENEVLMDATSIEAFDNATRETNGDLTTVSVKLSGNEYYTINVINLENQKLKLGKDIVIE